MRVLVAGWHGQVALALSAAAARRGDITAYAVGRPALDLTDHPSIGRTLFGIAPDVIINTAAYTDVEGAERDPQTAFRRNKLGAAALASQAARINVPIIHLSTVYVFDGEKATAYTEADATAPINAYGRSKRAGETAVAAANPRHVILRTGWIYSPFGRNFVTSLIERSGAERAMRVDDAQRGSPTYAPHLADAILDIAATIITDGDGRWGTYHVADRGFASWHDMACATFQGGGTADGHGTDAPAILPSGGLPNAAGAPRPRNAMLDCTKLKQAFGIELPEWQQALGACVEEIRNNAGGT